MDPLFVKTALTVNGTKHKSDSSTGWPICLVHLLTNRHTLEATITVLCGVLEDLYYFGDSERCLHKDPLAIPQRIQFHTCFGAFCTCTKRITQLLCTGYTHIRTCVLSRILVTGWDGTGQNIPPLTSDV